MNMLKKMMTGLTLISIAALVSLCGCDADQDGVFDITDNCPTTANFSQFDADLDGRGDACDNCPNDANVDQEDQDNDGAGAACDANDLNPLVQ